MSKPYKYITQVAVALLATLAAHVATAQNVTIYGIVDSGVEYVSNVGPTGARLLRVPTLTGSIPSRLGFRGSEDLGDGLKGIFTLEQGLAVDTGGLNQAGRAFGRQAFAGISGSWGKLTVGRQYTMTFWALGGLDQMGANVHSYGDMDGYLANARADNTIAYTGVFGPTTVGATYSFGRDTAAAAAGGANCPESTDSKACRNVSVMARYDADKWGVSASHEISYGNAGATGGLVSSDLSDSRSVLGAYAKFDNSLILGGGVIVRKNEGSATQPRSNLWFLGATYSLTPLTILDAQVARLDFLNSPNDSNYFDLRISQWLSKRTAIYLSAGHIQNRGTAAISVSGGTATGAAPPPGTNQSGLMAGIRHSF